MRISDWSSDCALPISIGQLGADANAARQVALDACADLGGEVAVLDLTGGVRIRERVVLFLGTLVAQACQQVRIPAAAFGDEVAAQVQRDPVLAPVQVVVVLEAGVLVVQLAIDRPVGADELAQAEGDERHAIGGAVTALEVVADAAGQVPAIVELLCVGGLRKGKAREKGDTQHADLHCRLLVYGYKARNRTENLTARYRRHRRPPPRTAARAPQSYRISPIFTITGEWSQNHPNECQRNPRLRGPPGPK